MTKGQGAECPRQRLTQLTKEGFAVNYNLLEEKWIPLLFSDGTTKRGSIKDALTQAHRIRTIAATNPMDRVAVLRFLLALLYWCQGNPPEEEHSTSSFPPDWFKKLDEHQDCFNLLGEGKRFYQCKGGGIKKLTADYLIHEVPTGTNLWHFRHATDGSNGLCCACCAMGLLRLPIFATSGGRGKPPGINSKPPIYVLPLGATLAETLSLCWRRVANLAAELGTPAWEKPDLQLPETDRIALLTGLTWLPRRVWLDDPGGPEGACISCGREMLLVRQAVFAGIGSMKNDSDSEPRAWSDPSVVWEGDEVVKSASALDASDAAAGQWIRTIAGILEGQKHLTAPMLWVVGFATVKNDKYLESTEYRFPCSAGLDEFEIQNSVARIRQWQKNGRVMALKMSKIIQPKAPQRKKAADWARAGLDAIRPHVEAQVSEKAGELAAHGSDAWEHAANEYAPMMAAVAKSLSPGFTAAALQRRREIASLKPDMRPKTNK
jgi:hypothetical protein